MPYTSSFFSTTTGYSGEQQLVDDLVVEQIALFGLDVQYLPRKHLNLDTLLHESSKSAFEVAMPMPVYVKSFDGYDNGMELLSKFGVRSADEVTLIMSRSQYEAYYGPYLETYYKEAINGGGELDRLKGQTSDRPKEGDLIYFPFDDGIFEIKYVMFDQPFFQLGKGYIFEMRCEKFEYSGESFSTGVTKIDDLTANVDYPKMEFTLETGGIGTFQLRERVRIYNVGSITTESDIGITTESGNGIASINKFRLYGTPGFLEDVPVVYATVMSWDKPNLKLVVSDITNQDPDQPESTSRDMDINKFDEVYIEGITSNATWSSANVSDQKIAFDDSDQIQTEFDDIKIIDSGDENPFGFV